MKNPQAAVQGCGFFLPREFVEKSRQILRILTQKYIFMDESNDEVRYGRDAKSRVYNELHIGRVHEYFYHVTQQCTKRF